MTFDPHTLPQAADILVVDDNIDNLRLLTEILTKAGYPIRSAEKPRLALESALAFPPGLILLDVMMPDMDGFEVCQQLKAHEHTREVPIIFISALQNVEDKVRGFEAGGIDFISKPFQKLEVLARVKTHLQLRKMQIHLEQLVSERTAELWETNQVLEEEIQERIQAEEERDRILNLSQDLLCIAGMDGYFKYLNPAWEGTLGYTNEELLAKPFLDFIHPDDHARNNEEVESLSRGKLTFNFENRYFHKDGSILTISWIATPLVEEQLMYCIGRNITERIQVETELRESEERFRSTFEQAAVGIAHVAPNGLFLRINQKFCDIVGYYHIEMEKLTFQDITHPDDLDNDLQQVERLLAGEIDSYSLEKRYYHKNGETVWINLTVSLLRKKTGESDYFVSVIEDITDRKAIELALNESEIKYRSLVEQASDAIIVIQDELIKFVNTRFTEITGHTFESLQDTPFTRYLPAEERTILIEMYQHRRDEETPSMVESIIQHKDGSRVEVELNGDLTTYDGKPAVLVFIRDITERKRVEREIQSYQEHLSALASQLTLTEERERRRIAAELHDHVGQSLAFTRMQVAAAQKAKTDARRNEILDEVSETLRDTIQETRSLIFDLSSPLMNELGLHAAVAEWLEERVEKRAGLKTEFIEIGFDLPMAEDVRAILFRNLRELLSNVIRHAQATSVRVTLEQTESQTRIIVEDDGVGFEPEKVSPTVTRMGRFGLFSIQERMNDLGGSLEIVSAPGKGSTITLTLPHQAV